MSDENNKRYIGEVFIDGKSDRLLQEFLTQLFNSYNGPGKGFNADMVDDWHLIDIIQYVDEGLETKLDTITIGNTVFTVYDSSKFLQLTDVIYNEFKDPNEAPWAQLLIDDGKNDGIRFNRGESTFYGDDEDYLASDIILDIYAVLDNMKVDVNTFAELEEFCQELCKRFRQLRKEFDDFVGPFADIIKEVEITDLDGNTKIIRMIDAQLINGFRIIPITQAGYDALPTKEKEYWRNIYIIVDEVPEDYVNPISFELFKDVKLVYNQETQYLDYYDGISEKPRPLISMVDLLKGIDFTSQFYEFLENNSDYTINPEALKESIKGIVLKESDFADLPFLTKKEAKVLASSITSDKGTITSSVNSNNFTTFNISKAFDTKFTEITNKINSIQTTMREYMGSTYYAKSYIDGKFEDIRSQLATLSRRIDTKLTKRESHYWVDFYLGDGKFYSSNNRYGISLTIRDNVGIITFNNPVFHWKNAVDAIAPPGQDGKWWNVLRDKDNYHTALPFVGGMTGEEWPQNFYANTSSNHGGIGRFRVTTSGQLQIFVEKEWTKQDEHGMGWGQLTIPWDDTKGVSGDFFRRWSK